MDNREMGKRRVEQFVMEIAQSLKQEGAVELLWWPAEQPQSDTAGRPDDTTVKLRIYKGNSWRSIGFAGSDIDGCVQDVEMLRKYEGEIAQSLAEL